MAQPNTQYSSGCWVAEWSCTGADALRPQRCRPAALNDRRSILTAEHIARLGVNKLNRYNLMLQCKGCDTIWSPSLALDGSLARGFWQCPNKCNW